jgi:hypothetical protein
MKFIDTYPKAHDNTQQSDMKEEEGCWGRLSLNEHGHPQLGK